MSMMKPARELAPALGIVQVSVLRGLGVEGWEWGWLGQYLSIKVIVKAQFFFL